MKIVAFLAIGLTFNSLGSEHFYHFIQSFDFAQAEHPLNIDYLDTVHGQEHLSKINRQLINNNLYLRLDHSGNQAKLTVNYVAPGIQKGNKDLLPIFSYECRTTNQVAGHPILEKADLDKLALFALRIGNDPSIVNPSIEKYLSDETFPSKLRRTWNHEVAPSLQKNLATLIGKEIAKIIIIKSGCIREFIPVDPVMLKKTEDLSSELQQKEEFTHLLLRIKKYHDSPQTSKFQDEKFMHDYEDLLKVQTPGAA